MGAAATPRRGVFLAAKRNPQTAAKRAREQALRERREIKKAKKQARIDAANSPEPVGEDDLNGDVEDAEGVGVVEVANAEVEQ